MKKAFASLITIGTLAAAFLPTWLVDKYTQVIVTPECSGNIAQCEFVEHFRPHLNTENNRDAARNAQRSFGNTFGRWVSL